MYIYIVIKPKLLGCEIRLVTFEKITAQNYVRYNDNETDLIIKSAEVCSKELYKIFAQRGVAGPDPRILTPLLPTTYDY